MADSPDYTEITTPAAHHSSHENGGDDEMSVLGLSGLLGDGQTPLAHKTSHQVLGADALSVAGLSGLLADSQTPSAHKASHQDGGADEISVANLSGLLADSQTPSAHKASHQDGGADEISVAGLSGLLATEQTPLAHKASHQDGGADEISIITLGDYEEGTWTPVYEGTGGTIGATNYANQSGTYRKIGKVVFIGGVINLTNNGDWTGAVLIKGLPFTPVAAFYGACFLGNIVYDGNIFSRVGLVETFVTFAINKSGANTSYLQCSGVPDVCTIEFSLFYCIA